MILDKIRFKYFQSRVQALLFDSKGEIKESDDFLLKLSGKNLFREIVLFEGMEETISQLPKAEELKFNCVHLTLASRESHYDFNIERVNDDLLSLVIYDFGEQYERVFELQQSRNLSDITSQKLKRENAKIHEENELINRLYQEMSTSGASEYVLLKSNNQLVNIDLNSINYFEAYGDYIKVHTESKMYVIHNRMKNLLEQLPSGKFVRIHRSFMVPINKIKNIEQMSLNIEDKILPIGKQYKQELLNQLNLI